MNREGDTKRVLREKLAAVLRDLMVEVDGKLERVIPWDHARKMTADEVISLFHFDHGIYHVHGGPMLHWNLTARLIQEHREKTATIDRPQIAKTDRISAKQQAFRQAVLAKAGQLPDAETPPPKQKTRWPSRKMQSRQLGKHRK